MKYLLPIILGLLLATIMIQATIFIWHFRIGKNLAKQATAFSYPVSDAELRILFVGDSTAVGTGVKNPIESTAGWFHQDFPQAEIVNISKNGVKINEIIPMLQQATGQFDLVVLQVGANNIIYFKNLEKSKQELKALILEAKKYSPNVVQLTSGNIGAAPIFPIPINWFYTWRSKKFLTEFKEVADKNDAAFVNLFQNKKDDAFLSDINKYYAADKLHLTGAGYRFWYEQIRAAMTEAEIVLD